MFVAAPIFVPIGLLLMAGIHHLCLMMVGGATRPFMVTFRVGCFAVAPALLGFVPFLGSFAGGIWGLVLLILGLAAGHTISAGKAAAAVLLPLAVCCACGVVALVLGGMAAFSGMMR